MISHWQLSDSQRDLVRETRRFAEKEIAPLAARWDAEAQVPRSHAKALAAAGFFGMMFSERYGGKGYSGLEAVLVIEEIARHCAVSARMMVDHNFGAVGAVLNYGSDEQRDAVLPAVACGDALISIAMTEPEIGSDLSSLATSARVEGNWIVLEGRKRWITGAGERDLTLVVARFNEVPGSKGIGAVLVEAGTTGFEAGERIPTLGVRGVREGELILRQVRVPKGNLVLEPGDGFRRLMSAYNGQRVGASAVALGIAQGAFDYAVSYADSRRQFGRRLTDFQATQFKIADMTLDLEAARGLVYRAAAHAVDTVADRYEASLAKAASAEMAIRVTNTAMQIMGGEGYRQGHPVERMLRDARMFTFGGGTTEMQRLHIASHVLGRRLPQRK